MFRVLVSDKMSKEGLAALVECETITCVEQNVNEVSDLESYDAILVRSATKVTEEVMEKMPNLKIIARAGVGVDNIDIAAATKRGIIVVNAPSGNTISTAEHTFAMMMALARNLCQANNSLKNGEWNRAAFQGVELKGKTLGIIGFGRIGSEIAKRAAAFEMTILTYDPFLTQARAEKLGVNQATLEELLAKSDVISVHTPLTKDTKDLLNMESFKKTKPGVMILNCARGGIINEDALAHYIESGHVAGAALDVYQSEPPENTNLIKLDQVIATPHIAASTAEAQLNVAVIVVEEVINFANGQPVRNGINLPAVSQKELAKIGPYYELTKSMGTMLSKIIDQTVKSLDVIYSGDVTNLETDLATRGLLAGFLQPKVDFVVNDVNAPVMAKDYGISYGEKYLDNGSAYTNLIKVEATTANTKFSIEGTWIKEIGSRIVNINGFAVDFEPTGNILVVEHNDAPGVIGKLGQILGSNGINIGTMQVGRRELGGAATMILTVDRAIVPAIKTKLNSITEIERITNIEF